MTGIFYILKLLFDGIELWLLTIIVEPKACEFLGFISTNEQ